MKTTFYKDGKEYEVYGERREDLSHALNLAYPLNKSKHEKVFNFAWDLNHSNGFREVVDVYGEIANIIVNN